MAENNYNRSSQASMKGGIFMPRFDGTGPWGAGPMTGGGRGFCSPAGGQYMPIYARRLGRGRGSRGWRGQNQGYGRGFGSRSSFSALSRVCAGTRLWLLHRT